MAVKWTERTFVPKRPLQKACASTILFCKRWNQPPLPTVKIGRTKGIFHHVCMMCRGEWVPLQPMMAMIVWSLRFDATNENMHNVDIILCSTLHPRESQVVVHVMERLNEEISTSNFPMHGRVRIPLHTSRIWLRFACVWTVIRYCVKCSHPFCEHFTAGRGIDFTTQKAQVKVLYLFPIRNC